MRLKVVTQLSLGDKDGVHELLDLGVVSLGIGQDLANEVHGTFILRVCPSSSRSTIRVALTTCMVATM